MEIEIVETKKVKKIVNLDLPYYFRHDLDNSIIYGKLDEKNSISIQITRSDRGELQSVEIEIEPIRWDYVSCYLKKEHKGSEAEYLDAKKEAFYLLEKA